MKIDWQPDIRMSNFRIKRGWYWLNPAACFYKQWTIQSSRKTGIRSIDPTTSGSNLLWRTLRLTRKLGPEYLIKQPRSDWIRQLAMKNHEGSHESLTQNLWSNILGLDKQQCNHILPIGPRIVNELKHQVIHTNMICNIDHNVVIDGVHRLPVGWMAWNRCSSKIAYAPSIVGVLELELQRNSICSKHCRGPGTEAPSK
jgi:hypothetical protein